MRTVLASRHGRGLPITPWLGRLASDWGFVFRDRQRAPGTCRPRRNSAMSRSHVQDTPPLDGTLPLVRIFFSEWALPSTHVSGLPPTPAVPSVLAARPWPRSDRRRLAGPGFRMWCSVVFASAPCHCMIWCGTCAGEERAGKIEKEEFLRGGRGTVASFALPRVSPIALAATCFTPIVCQSPPSTPPLRLPCFQ